MKQVVIDGWREGSQKITVSVAEPVRAEQLAERLQALGAKAYIV